MRIEPRLDLVLDRPFVFHERPISVAADSRVIWRVPLLLMLTRSCRGEKATQEQLHVLNWAVRSSDSAERLASFLAGDLRPEEAVVRFEPALNRALALARGLELLGWEGRYWTLREPAREILAAIDGDDDLMSEQKALLGGLDRLLTQKAVTELFGRGPR